MVPHGRNMRIRGRFEPTKAFMGDPWLSWCFLMPMMPQLESKSDRYIKSDAHHHTQPNTAELRRVSFLVLRFPCEFSCLFLTQDFSTQNSTKFHKGNGIFNINQNRLSKLTENQNFIKRGILCSYNCWFLPQDGFKNKEPSSISGAL